MAVLLYQARLSNRCVTSGSVIKQFSESHTNKKVSFSSTALRKGRLAMTFEEDVPMATILTLASVNGCFGFTVPGA